MKRLILSIFMALTAYQVFAATHGTEGILLDATQSLYIIPLNDNTLRVQYRLCQEQKNIPFDAYLDASSTFTDYKVVKKADIIKVQCKAISVIYNKADGCLTFYDVNNKIILQEAVNSSSSAKNGEFFTINQSFNSPDNEFIIGLGQFQDGYLNIKGLSRRLTQVNTQIAIPMVISNMGYGLLWNNYGITEFNPLSNKTVLVQKSEVGPAVSVNATGTAGNVVERRAFGSFEAEITVPQDGMYSILLDVGQAMGRKHYLEIDSKSVINISNTWLPPTTSTLVYLSAGNHKLTVQGSRGDKPVVYWDAVNNLNTFKSELASAIDYTVFAGNADNIIASLRSLTGRSPMQPKYALGYIHCRERYDTQEQVLQAAHEFRNRNIPVDVIVQDWQWWGKYGWNAMKFDEDKYPNPEAMVKELHDMDMKFMLSVWSKIDRKSEVGKDMESKGYYIDGTDWIDFFNENASKEYWNYSKNNILKATDLDGWWQDATEPENDDLHNRKVNSNTLNGDLYRNVYPNLVNQTVYNGLVESDSERRPLILTRSGFTGIQRFGAINWSGDVGNDWDSFKRQIVGGLGLMATGQPWWTYDAGGFFRPGDQYTNADYKERMLRWIQTSVFLPVMRVHGYMSRTEPWQYDETTCNSFVSSIKERYLLLPYLYSLAYKVSSQDYTMMRPLVFDYPDDNKAIENITDFMCGPSILVSPITESAVSSWKTYLPVNEGGWYSYKDGSHFEGGKYATVSVSKDYIPTFVKAGSILPLGSKDSQFARDKDDEPITIVVYTGVDANFELYQDYADNYDYKNGDFSLISIKWNEKANRLTINPLLNAKAQKFNIIIKSEHGQEINDSVSFEGKKLTYIYNKKISNTEKILPLSLQ